MSNLNRNQSRRRYRKGALASFLIAITVVSVLACEETPKGVEPASATTSADNAKITSAEADSISAKQPFHEGLMPLDGAKLKSSSPIDPEMFRRVMSKRRSSFKVCYKKALSANPQAAGEVDVRFNISPTGRVSTVKVVESSLNHVETEACIIRVIRHIRFPRLPSRQRVSVEYPLVFAP